MLLGDPGPCPVCDAPHHSCVETASGAILVDMLPASTQAAQLAATQVQATLPAGTFTSATYRGTPPRRPRRGAR